MKNSKEAESKSQATIEVPVPDYTEIPILKRSKLSSLVESRQEIRESIKEMEKKQKELSSAIETLLYKAEAKAVMVSDWRVLIVELAGRRSLSAALLLKQGVSTKVIEKATVIGNPSSYVDVRKVGAAAKTEGD